MVLKSSGIAAAALVALCATTAGADGWAQHRDWQTITGSDGCAAWTVMECGEPFPNIGLGFSDNIGHTVTLSSTAWQDNGAPVRPNDDGFVQITLTVSALPDGLVVDMVPVEHRVFWRKSIAISRSIRSTPCCFAPQMTRSGLS